MSKKQEHTSIVVEMWRTLSLVLFNPSIKNWINAYTEKEKWRDELLNISNRYAPSEMNIKYYRNFFTNTIVSM